MQILPFITIGQVSKRLPQGKTVKILSKLPQSWNISEVLENGDYDQRHTAGFNTQRVLSAIGEIYSDHYHNEIYALQINGATPLMELQK